MAVSASAPIATRRGGPRLPAVPVGVLAEAAVVWLMLGMWLGLLGPLAPLMVLTGGAALVALYPARLLRMVRLWPLLLIGVLALTSALWSSEPQVSARYGLQLFVTIAIAGVAAAACPPGQLVRGLFIACAVVLVLSILSGRQGVSASGPVLIGLLGSKNEMGTLCFILLASSATVALGKDQPRWMRLGAVPMGLLGTLYLLMAFSAGSVLGAAIFFGVFGVLIVGSKLSGSAKFLLALTILVLATPLWMIRSDLAGLWEHFLVDVLNKDPGLTGRDYLWAHADRLIAQQPLLGHGYRSTWLGHGADTIGLLRWAGLQSGEGFSFHNSYREWLVDFGWVGACLIVLALGIGLLRTVLRAMGPQTDAATLFFASMGLVFAIRGYFEYVFGPFSSSTIIVVIVAGMGYLAAPAVARRPAPRSRSVELKVLGAEEARHDPAV